jgi:hypothetical protein
VELGIKYQGRVATTEDIEFIKAFIAENPHDSRRKLSERLCKEWNWVQSNGALRDMVCRGYLLCLERAGHITLPPKRYTPNNPLSHRRTPSKVEINREPIYAAIADVKPLELRQVRRTPEEKLFNSLVAQLHYLGYCHPVGEHLKYLVYLRERPIACFSWSSAPRHIGCRDKHIGWPAEVRRKNLHLIAYNSRFLLFPWVHISHVASHLLGQMAKVLPVDWQRMYNHPIYYLETFVDTERFKGVCYKAANWQHLGFTTGRGKNDHTNKINRSIKAVLGYPLRKDFREALRNG